MSAGHNDPRLLYAIPGIKAYHIQNGEKASLTPSGPQTLSLLMVPTSSPFSDLSTTIPQNEIPEEDFYLHLNLPPELDLPMPATTQIFHQPPNSYLIPRWDLGPESGAFTLIEFPPVGTREGNCSQEDIDTFETILAQCTAFLERATAPVADAKGGLKPYNPGDYKRGEGYVRGNTQNHSGQIVLVDEDDGSVVGELTETALVTEDSKLMPGRKDPVEIEISPDGKRISVAPLSDDYLRMAKHPAYQSSSLVQNAAAASRLIVTTSGKLSNLLADSAQSFTQKTKPVNNPLEFSPAAHARARKINNLTQSAAGLSAKTLGSATKIAQNLGAGLAGRGEKKDKDKGMRQVAVDKDGQPVFEEYNKPGFMNKSMIAFSTIADGLAYSGKNLLTSSHAAATTVVQHRYGENAGRIAGELAGGVKNVGLVYIDVTGVSRRAVIKSVAKGMVVGRVKGGGEVVVGGGDGGMIPDDALRQGGGVKMDNDHRGEPGGVAGFGSRQAAGALPSYGEAVGPGESLHGQPAGDEKRRFG